MNRLRHQREIDLTTGALKTAKFTPLQAVARAVAIEKPAPAYIRGRPVRRVDQLPGLPMPAKVQVFRGGVAFDDCVVLPFPFPPALQAWLTSQARSWWDACRLEEDQVRIYQILGAIERAYLRFGSGRAREDL